MNIGVVTDFYYPWIGGPSTVIRNIGHGLAARGHSVSVLAPSAEGKHQTESDGPLRLTRVSTVPVPFGYELRSAVWPRSQVERWLDEVRPDVVHVHHPFPLSATAVRAGKRRRIPVAATNHTIPDCSLWGLRSAPRIHDLVSAGFGRWIVWLLHQCDAVATPTETAADALERIGFRGRVRAISNGIDTQRFRPSPVTKSLRSSFGLDERPVVLYTGRLDAEKEMNVWLRAARLVLATLDIQFLIGGNGAERAALQDLATELGVARNVRFTGYLDDAVFPSIYNLANVYCITSRVELQSIATLEALASGLPVVGVRGGALPELVRDGVNGYLATPGSESEVSAALLKILADGPAQVRMGEESRRVASRHALETSIEQYEKFLASVVAGASG